MGPTETGREAVNRTASTPLAAWITHPVFRGYDPSSPLQDSGLLDYEGGISAADLIASGISAVDLCAYADIQVPDAPGRRQTTGRDDLHAAFLFARLYAMHQHLPSLGLRDALGYAFLAQQVQSHGGDAPVLALISDWDAIGHAANGWALTAAGIMPDEAATNPLPDETTLATMLALRPAALPHD